jgi:low temperature requirement protein LtrA
VQAGGTGSAEVRFSTIELFFDLVFVFAAPRDLLVRPGGRFW